MSDPQSPDLGSVFCTSCGYKLAEEDRFCPECGQTRPSAPLPPTVAGTDVPPPPPLFPPAGIGGSSQVPPSPPAGIPDSPFQSDFSSNPFPATVPPGAFAGGMSMSMAPVAAEPGELLFDVEYPDHLSRLLIFVKWLLAIPHLLVLSLLSMVIYYIVWPISWLVILVTGKYPLGMWEFVVGYLRWQANTYAYISLQRDEYPPFSMDPRHYPVQFEMEYPTHLSRLLIFVKWLLILPTVILLVFLGMAAFFALFAAWFAILFTGRFPRGMFGFVTGTYRLSYRLSAYSLLLTDRFPGFSLD